MLHLVSNDILQAVFEKRLKDAAVAVPLMCCAADMLSVPSRKQVVLVGSKLLPDFENMLAAAHASYEPNKTVSKSPCFYIIKFLITAYVCLCSSDALYSR